MSERLVYFNGNFIPERDARISIFDSGIMYGDICFELTRSFKQKPYRLRDHLDRLYESLSYAEIDCGLSKDEMEEVSLELVERSLPAVGDFEFHLYHNISRGGMGLYEELINEGTDPIVAINIFPVVRTLGRMAKRYEEGAHFVTPRQQSVPWRCISPRAKTHSRLHYKLADIEVGRMGDDLNALLTDDRGYLTEGTGNNFFMVRGRSDPDPKSPQHPVRHRPQSLPRGNRASRHERRRNRPRTVRCPAGQRSLVHQHHHLHDSDHPFQLQNRR